MKGRFQGGGDAGNEVEGDVAARDWSDVCSAHKRFVRGKYSFSIRLLPFTRAPNKPATVYTVTVPRIYWPLFPVQPSPNFLKIVSAGSSNILYRKSSRPRALLLISKYIEPREKLDRNF